MDDEEELTIGRLRNFLAENELKYETAQKGLCFAIIKRMHRRIRLGYRFDPIRVCRYKKMVIDGNHTYISYLLADIEVKEFDGTSSHCDVPKGYKAIEIDEVNDWDDHTEKGRKYKNDKYLLELTRIIEVR